MSNRLEEAKEALDSIIKKARVHLYKPIQLAEILYKNRTTSDVDLLELEQYRNASKKWRDLICQQFLGRVCTSSARFQDNLFEDNAMPPHLLNELGIENRKKKGIVEAYIYSAFERKHLQLENALAYCLNGTKETFKVKHFLELFWKEPGLKRSLDKIFEIVVYSLFEVLITSIEVKIDIYYEEKKRNLLEEFSGFAEKVLRLDANRRRKTLEAHFHRVGVTNAADRGLDMYANFGSVVQVKHLSLDEELAENVVTSITSDKIIIVCKDSEESVITSLLSQIGWRSRIQSVITINELSLWYDTALQGSFANILGDRILSTLVCEMKAEFPSVGSHDFQEFKKQRGYHLLQDAYWHGNVVSV